VKLGLISLGCPKNLVDSEVMLGLVQQAGHDITPDPGDADILVVNTCAFIDKAKQESVDAILEMAAHKQTGRCRRLIVTGCLAERYRSELQAEIPEIDVLLGTGEVPEILRALDGVPGGSPSGSGRISVSSMPVAETEIRPDPGVAPPGVAPGTGGAAAAAPVAFYRRDVGSPSGSPSGSGRIPVSSMPVAETEIRPDPGMADPGVDGRPVATRLSARHRATPGRLPTYLYDAQTPRVLATPRHLAYVKIAEGCDYNCAFCIIPTLRGQYRSRATESIVEEARQLAARGVKELILISQDTTFYGVDRRERGALARLLRHLDAIQGLEWIRLLYLYPTTLTDDVLEAMAELPSVCKYIDLPLQHSAEPVLRRMRRPGNRRSYEQLLDRIRRRVPGVTLRTTVIVGFPGETTRDFADLCAFARTVEFDHLGVFTYSHEEGTAAFALEDDVSRAEKASRCQRLVRLQQAVVRRRNANRVGQRCRVLVDGPSPEHPLVLQGRLEGQAPDIDPVVYLTECDPGAAAPGTMLEAEIIEARGVDLVARPFVEDGSMWYPN
jgi:ribosomal protein S12 methylthiotransferase